MHQRNKVRFSRAFPAGEPFRNLPGISSRGMVFKQIRWAPAQFRWSRPSRPSSGNVVNQVLSLSYNCKARFLCQFLFRQTDTPLPNLAKVSATVMNLGGRYRSVPCGNAELVKSLTTSPAA